MSALPSQITAAGLSTLVILGIAMLNALEVVRLDEKQLMAVGAFVVAASNFGFGILLWYVNIGVPNPTVERPDRPIE